MRKRVPSLKSEVEKTTDVMCAVIADILDNFPEESLRGEQLGRLEPVVDLIKKDQERNSLLIVYRPNMNYDRISRIYFDFEQMRLSGLYVDINDFDYRIVSDHNKPLTKTAIDPRLVLAYSMITHIADINHLHSNYDEMNSE